jgi:hypothetical protein
MGVFPVTVVLQQDTTYINTHHKITHHAQIKHSIQSYTNNEGRISHNEYNAEKIKLPL